MSISDDLSRISLDVARPEDENGRLLRLVDSLTEQLENRGEDEKLARLINSVAVMADLYRTKFDVLPEMTKQVIVAYDKWKGEETSAKDAN